MESINAYLQVIQRIAAAENRAGRIDHATLIAVSKFQPIEKIMELYAQGQRIFGENYVQELIEKKSALQEKGYEDIDFHFIGHLQSNKVKSLLPHVTAIHSVDSLKLLLEIEKQAALLQKEIRVFFQLNLDDEETKGGFAERDLDSLSLEFSKLKFTKLAGWMVIPDPKSDPREAFIKLKLIARNYQDRVSPGLSMGMSDDYELAVEIGATFVRVGSAIFGQRG